jgi:hypothetical protein
VTYAAARSFIEPGGYKEHEVEAARRALTELLIDARQQTDPQPWRTRKRSTKLDISAIVQQEGRLLVVTYITAQPYAQARSRVACASSIATVSRVNGSRPEWPMSSSMVVCSRVEPASGASLATGKKQGQCQATAVRPNPTTTPGTSWVLGV